MWSRLRVSTTGGVRTTTAAVNRAVYRTDRHASVNLVYRVSTTPGNPGNLLEFENPPGNPGNLLEFKWSSWKFLCND